MKLLTDCNGRRFMELNTVTGNHLLVDTGKIEYINSCEVGTFIMMTDGFRLHSSDQYEDIIYALFAPRKNFDEERAKTSELIDGADTTIYDSNLSIRSRNILLRHWLRVKKDPTIRDISSMTKKECSKLYNIGKKSLTEIETKLTEYGLKFKDETED